MTETLEQRLVRRYKASTSEDEKHRILAELAPIKEKEFRGHMAPPGGIPGLHPALEKRRWIYGIPNGAFQVQAAFNVCLVWQISRFDTDMIGDTGLYMSKQTEKRMNDETPRGIIVSAGLAALDALRSNGIDIGHVVTMLRLAPWRMPCDMVGGVEQYVLILRAGDITGSEDLEEARRRGDCKFVYDEGTGQHQFVDKDGKRWDPKLPFIGADY